MRKGGDDVICASIPIAQEKPVNESTRIYRGNGSVIAVGQPNAVA